MNVLAPVTNHKPGLPDYLYWCPGCRCAHGIWVREHPGYSGPVWGWNGDLVKPTFNPSVLVCGGEKDLRCHSFVREGRIQFLGDCAHGLAGQTVAMEPIIESKEE